MSIEKRDRDETESAILGPTILAPDSSHDEEETTVSDSPPKMKQKKNLETSMNKISQEKPEDSLDQSSQKQVSKISENKSNGRLSKNEKEYHEERIARLLKSKEANDKYCEVNKVQSNILHMLVGGNKSFQERNKELNEKLEFHQKKLLAHDEAGSAESKKKSG